VTFKDDMTVKCDLATQDPTRRKVNMIRSTTSKDNYQRNVGKTRISNLRLNPEAETRIRNNQRVITSQHGEMLVNT
jgi:hypothetical protein